MLGDSTGAAVIFGVTGGVMEAALRTAYEAITGQKLEKLEFMDVRGLEGVKEASYNLNGLEVKVAVAHSTGAAARLLDSVRSGEKSYTFIEVMGCPGGCVNGGGPADRLPDGAREARPQGCCAPRPSTRKTRPSRCASRMKTRPL